MGLFLRLGDYAKPMLVKRQTQVQLRHEKASAGKAITSQDLRECKEADENQKPIAKQKLRGVNRKAH
jgi:hypothetical protein